MTTWSPRNHLWVGVRLLQRQKYTHKKGKMVSKESAYKRKFINSQIKPFWWKPFGNPLIKMFWTLLVIYYTSAVDSESNKEKVSCLGAKKPLLKFDKAFFAKIFLYKKSKAPFSFSQLINKKRIILFYVGGSKPFIYFKLEKRKRFFLKGFRFEVVKKFVVPEFDDQRK